MGSQKNRAYALTTNSNNTLKFPQNLSIKLKSSRHKRLPWNRVNWLGFGTKRVVRFWLPKEPVWWLGLHQNSPSSPLAFYTTKPSFLLQKPTKIWLPPFLLAYSATNPRNWGKIFSTKILGFPWEINGADWWLEVWDSKISAFFCNDPPSTGRYHTYIHA